MISRLTIVVVAMAGICCAMPVGAEEVGVGVGPVGVVVGPDHRDRDRDVVRERDHRDGDKVIIIKKDHDRDRDYDHH